MITFEGYNVVFENRVYSRSSSVRGANEEIEVYEVLIPVVFTEPHEEQVFNHIKRIVSQNQSALILPKGTKSKKSPLEDMIAQLPEKVRMDIRSEDENIIRFIKGNTSAPKLREGELPNRYLQVLYGSLPTQLVRTNQDKGFIKDPEWYHDALSDNRINDMGFGEELTMKLLLEKDVLPVRKTINFLVKCETSMSRVLRINRIRYDQRKVADILKAVYSGITRPEDISQLNNFSDKLLEQMSMEPIIGLYQMIKIALQQQPQINPIEISLKTMGSQGIPVQ